MRVLSFVLISVVSWYGTEGPTSESCFFGLGEGPLWVRDRAGDSLGTDRRRSRQRTATIGVFGFATVYLVRHALADIKRARLSDERLAVRTASCGSRRERFAARRVGEHVSSDVSLCTSYKS